MFGFVTPKEAARMCAVDEARIIFEIAVMKTLPAKATGTGYLIKLDDVLECEHLPHPAPERKQCPELVARTSDGWPIYCRHEAGHPLTVPHEVDKSAATTGPKR